MQKLVSYLLLFSAIPFMGFVQEKDEELIDWKSSKLLTWNDYKGKPDARSDAAASTTTYLGIEYNIGAGGFSYKIQCRFSKTRSWVATKTDYILQHEQGHFDIAEIFARKLHKQMREYKYDKQNFKTDLRNIYEKVTKEKEDLQNQYDSETDHSRKSVHQAEWLKKIDSMLVEFSDYADY